MSFSFPSSLFSSIFVPPSLVLVLRNAEEVEKLSRQIGEQRSRQLKADTGKRRMEDLLQEIAMTLWNVCDKFRVSNLSRSIAFLIV